jgi:hypothetical protein
MVGAVVEDGAGWGDDGAFAECHALGWLGMVEATIENGWAVVEDGAGWGDDGATAEVGMVGSATGNGCGSGWKLCRA